MLQITPQMRVLVAVAPVDFRKGIDGLASLCKAFLKQDPFAGTVFVFRNRRRDRMKVIYWDRDGFALWYKRLERGTFRFPAPRDGAHSVEVDHATLTLILEGIDVRGVRRQQRFQRSSQRPA